MKLHGVSIGNGNDGVSHLFPNYYVMTDDPYSLARLAIIHDINPGAQKWAAEVVEVEGEADYTVSAVIYDPPYDKPEVRNYYDCGCCGHYWSSIGNMGEKGTCDECYGEVKPSDYQVVSSWSDRNGAWKIVEVFPIIEGELQRVGVHRYNSIVECFGNYFVKEYSNVE